MDTETLKKLNMLNDILDQVTEKLHSIDCSDQLMANINEVINGDNDQLELAA